MHPSYTPGASPVEGFKKLNVCHFVSERVPGQDVRGVAVVKRVGDVTGALYLITEDMERMYFPNSMTYHTWYEDFSGVKSVDADFDEWWPPASQSVVAPRPGSDLLFKTTASARVYAMSTGNQRLHIADEASAAALFGTNWASKVIDWPDFVMSGWTIAGEEISEPYDGFIASNDGENYQFMDDEWLMVDGDLPDFITPFAYANFHADFLKGKPVVIGCPKLDETAGYSDKIAEIIKAGNVKKVTVAHMEVPCCFGLLPAIEEAIASSGKKVPFNDVTISVKGERIK